MIVNVKLRRQRLFDNQYGLCIYCNDPMILKYSRELRKHPKRATIEHIIPSSEGGSNSLNNMVCSCSSCNSRRGSIEHNKFMFLRQFGDWMELTKIEHWKLENIYSKKTKLRKKQINERIMEIARFDIKIKQSFIYV